MFLKIMGFAAAALITAIVATAWNTLRQIQQCNRENLSDDGMDY